MKIFNYSLIGLLLVLGAQAADRARNVRVVWSGSPQSEAVVVWEDSAADPTAELLYDVLSHTDKDAGYAFKAPVAASGRYEEGVQKSKKNGKTPASPSSDLFYHHAPLKSLQPGRVYYIAVKTADGIGREYHFKTAPNDGAPIKLIYAGDSRTEIAMARKISVQISGMIQEDDAIAALLHGGDYAGATRIEPWNAWLEAYALTTTEDGKLLPIIPVVGNHDVIGNSPIFRQAYGFPGGPHDYYTCRLTPSVGIVCLNTEISAAGEQLNFLRAALTDFKKENLKWQMAAYHRPAYPAVKQASAAKVSWVPLFEEFNLDLALESDGHCIKRTVPIRGNKESADGVVYLGEGGYGAPQRDPKPDLWYLQGDNAFASKGDHIMMLEITPDAIHYSTVLDSGDVVDSATFHSKR